PARHIFAPGAGAPTIRGGSGLSVGAPPDRRTARCEPAHHTFALRGCSYNTRWAGLSVGAPPDRRTAPVRTGQAQTSPKAGATSTATPTAPSTPPNSNTPPPNSPPTNSTTPAWPTAYLPP